MVVFRIVRCSLAKVAELSRRLVRSGGLKGQVSWCLEDSSTYAPIGDLTVHSLHEPLIQFGSIPAGCSRHG